MKATELRLNNLIQFTEVSKKRNAGYPTTMDGAFKIDSIFKDTVSVVNLTNATFTDISLEANTIEPIPITEEWLFKMGFLLSRLNIKNYMHPQTILFELRNVSVLDGGFKIRIGHDEAFSFKAISNEIIYVHQLQNLYFALTCEELTIKEL